MGRHKVDLQLAYEPREEWAHFVLHIEPEGGHVASAFNRALSFEERDSPYVHEWLGRLRSCEPTALHCALVEKAKIPRLFHPCVYDDKDSPAAVQRSGCTCRQTWYDPEFGLPVVGEHYRTVGGAIETWTYLTYTPLALRANDTFEALIVDAQAGQYWIRTGDGILALAPQDRLRGFNIGYGGGGPTELARYIQRIVASRGRDTGVDVTRRHRDADLPRHIHDWVSNKAAAVTAELTLEDLAAIQRGHRRA
ncbi:hypothetical protein [Yinghuangia aomiensis]